MKPGDILVWQCPRFPHVVHKWRVVGVHLGGKDEEGRDTESLIEMESITHAPGWTGHWEYHPRVFVPEPLTRGLKVESSDARP
jgi:hypothetical protein